MKHLKLFFVCLLVVSISNCGKYLYDVDLDNTSWMVDFDWDSGEQGIESITFYSDGTTSWGGYWTEYFDEISWSFTTDNKTAYYEGTVSGKKMKGTMSNTAGDEGTWSAKKE